jgi:hypothetical protein
MRISFRLQAKIGELEQNLALGTKNYESLQASVKTLQVCEFFLSFSLFSLLYFLFRYISLSQYFFQDEVSKLKKDVETANADSERMKSGNSVLAVFIFTISFTV